MKTPPLLLGSALLFWGWQTEYWLFAAIMAVIVEGSRFMTVRWELSLKDFQRVADVCSVIFIGTLVYRFTANISDENFFPLRWLPISLFPLLIAQIYSTENTVDLRALFLLLRRPQQGTQQQAPIKINLTYPYGAICILAAGATDVRTIGFYIGALFLCAWALFATRSSRYPFLVWGILFLFAAGMGYGAHVRIRQFQVDLEENATLILWLRLLRQEFNPYQSSTAIGRIGSVKLSNEVVCRAKMLSETRRPSLLLRETSYTIYKDAKWYAPDVKFTRIGSEADDTTWILRQGTSQAEDMLISEYLTKGKGMLKVPDGTFQISQLLVGNMEINPYGAIKVDEGPGLVKYQASFDVSQALDSPPDEHDLALPPDEETLFRTLTEELALTSLPPEQVLRKIAAFFREHFSYSLEIKKDDQEATPLADFLYNVRSGHCEYFATATVLLLRAAGIPARYAVGYAVEGLQPGRWTIVRGGDAHAWTQVYLNDRWHNFDTTPPSWRAYQEAGTISLLKWLTNAWAGIKFAFSEWRWRQSEGGNEPYLFGILAVLVSILVWRLYKTRRRKIVFETQQTGQYAQSPSPGMDSAFYLIEKRLHETGLSRHEWEPLSLWLQRIEENTSPQLFQDLAPILALHYQYRFDPNGLSETEKSSLQNTVQVWLELHSGEQQME